MITSRHLLACSAAEGVAQHGGLALGKAGLELVRAAGRQQVAHHLINTTDGIYHVAVFCTQLDMSNCACHNYPAGLQFCISGINAIS
jgi:hypothetical protein